MGRNGSAQYGSAMNHRCRFWRCRQLSAAASIALLGAPFHSAAAQSCPRDTATTQALRDAMHSALLTPGGAYSILATTNSVRFQSAVFQQLIERALQARPSGGTLFLPYDAMWWEYLSAAGLSASEEGKAPIGRRLAYEYHQDIEVSMARPAASSSRSRREPRRCSRRM